MRYIKIYRDAILAAGVMILMVVAAPTIVSVAMSYVTASAATALAKSRPLVTLGIQCFFFVVGAVAVWFLAKAQSDVVAEKYVPPEAVNTYRQMRDSGVDPTIARRVVSASAEMEPTERTKDWEQANQPNFSAELNRSLGVDPEARKMMRDFFVASSDAPDSRRSFSSSTQISVENNRIQKSHMVDGVIEPVQSNPAPPPPIIAEQASPPREAISNNELNTQQLPQAEPDSDAQSAVYLPPPPIVAEQADVEDVGQAATDTEPIANAEPVAEEKSMQNFLTPRQETAPDEKPKPHSNNQFVPPPPPAIIADGDSLFNIRLNE